MKEGFRQSQVWLHTWSGLIMGWVLFMMFATGTLSVFRDEISHWMKPEVHSLQPVQAPNKALNLAFSVLQNKAEKANMWSITLPTDRNPALQLFWFGQGQRGRLLLDPATGNELKPRQTVGGDFYYQMHFQLWYLSPMTGRLITCIITMFMLVALVTGVIAHKKIIKDVFVFRGNKGQRSWLDGHNVSAVVALPFHLMISFTGVLIILGFFIPWGNKAVYDGGGRGQFHQQAYNLPNFNQKPSGEYAAIPALQPLFEKFTETFEGQKAGNITIYTPNQTNSQIVLSSVKRQAINARGLLFDSRGDVVSTVGPTAPAATMNKTLDSLHRGHFASYSLRWLYFLSGIAGCFMIASGLILWLVKRQAKAKKLQPDQAPLSHRIVQVLNVATIGGLSCALPSLLIINRLLPLAMNNRRAWEAHCFFIVWAATLIYSMIRPYKKAWIELLIAGATTCLLVPIVNALTTSSSLLQTLGQANWMLAGVDLTCIGFGVALSWLSYKVINHQPYKPVHKAKPVITLESSPAI